MKQHYDVVILGGGLAGLALARQLKRARHDLSILVAEKRKHPAPEAAFKVGESSIEVGAHYYGRVLGMDEHIDIYQLPKLGLRFFFTAAGNTDIARRPETGPFRRLPLPSYQLDRGRFENALAAENVRQGVEFADGCKAKEITFGAERHTVRLARGEEECEVTARWVIDAAGRASLLKRKLGLRKEAPHNINAAWFRINENIAVDDWSDDPEYTGRLFRGLRRLSTNHLMGRGYWVWLIPLASNSTSVGIVADDALHPIERINRFERAMEWLREHEPQCAKVVEPLLDKLQDFLVLRHYSHDCEQVFSADRWCITGEAGVFADPLYSVGSDFIAISNTIITDLITRDLRGEPIAERVEFYQRFYLDFWYRTVMYQFEGQYPIMGNAQIMTMKLVWDHATYWGVVGMLFFHDKIADLEFMAAVMPELWRFNRLNHDVQKLFREWDQRERPRDWQYVNADLTGVDFLARLQPGMAAGHDDERLKAQLTANLDFFELLAEELQRRAHARPALTVSDAGPDSYVMRLRPALAGAEDPAADPERAATLKYIAAELDKVWYDALSAAREQETAVLAF